MNCKKAQIIFCIIQRDSESKKAILCKQDGFFVARVNVNMAHIPGIFNYGCFESKLVLSLSNESKLAL